MSVFIVAVILVAPTRHHQAANEPKYTIIMMIAAQFVRKPL